MKSLLLSIGIILFVGIALIGQPIPACTFNYQAAVRNASDEIIPNRNVRFRLSVLEELKGAGLYVEEHMATTSSLGLVNLEVGAGTKTGGPLDWMDIEWASKRYYLKLEIDVNGGQNYEILGESPVLSVPIANTAKNAMTANNISQDAVLNVTEVNSPEINTTTLNADVIGAEEYGFFDDFGFFKTVIKKNNGFIWIWIDKVVGGDLCANKLELFDDQGNPHNVLDVDGNGAVVLNATNTYTNNFVATDQNGDEKFIINPNANPNTEYVNSIYGNLRVNGIMMATTKQFLIDHPLDPEHKNLRHYSIESDKMLNIYSGTVTLDKKGEAWIQLPDWFEALNTNFSYQLTCLGGFANVYIDKKINQNRFKVAGGKKDLEVSWQISGERHDKQALELSLPIEELKTTPSVTLINAQKNQDR